MQSSGSRSARRPVLCRQLGEAAQAQAGGGFVQEIRFDVGLDQNLAASGGRNDRK